MTRLSLLTLIQGIPSPASMWDIFTWMCSHLLPGHHHKPRPHLLPCHHRKPLLITTITTRTIAIYIAGKTHLYSRRSPSQPDICFYKDPDFTFEWSVFLTIQAHLLKVYPVLEREIFGGHETCGILGLMRTYTCTRNVHCVIVVTWSFPG